MRLKLPKSKERLRREAASWLARLQSRRDPGVERKFRRWYEDDPANAAAFDRVQRSYDSAALLRRSDAFATEPSDHRAPRARPLPRYALAAAVALALLVPATILLSGGGLITPNQASMVILTTAVGEIREVRLADGSTVTLDTASDLQVEIGRDKRRASLKKGRARFQVAKAADPFVIDSGTLTITTPHGILDVERSGTETRVDLLAGTAAMRGGAPEAPPQSLEAGNVVKFIPGRPIELHASRGRSDWTQGMLHFDSTRLAEAVELANRYSSRRIVLEPGLEGLKVTGAFRAGDTDGLAKAIAVAFDLSLRPAADGRLILSSRAAT